MDAMVQKGHVIMSLGQTLNDSLIAVAIVISLPASYDTLKTILMSSDDTLTTEKVTTAVLCQEKDRNHGSDMTALVARNGNRSGNKGKGFGGHGKGNDNKKKHIKCDFCGKRGHVKDECRKLKAVQSGEQPKALTAKVSQTDENGKETFELFVAAETQCKLKVQRWILDSGASRSMSSQREWFHSLHQLSKPKAVWLGDDHCIYTTHHGRLSLEFKTPTGNIFSTCFDEVYYVPELSGNLLSISHVTQRGYTVSFADKGCEITHREHVSGFAKQVGGIYIVQCQPLAPAWALIAQIDVPLTSLSTEDLDDSLLTAYVAKENISKADEDTWHRRLGHVNIDSVLCLVQKGMVIGMDIITGKSCRSNPCEPCLKGKQS
ncbi:hypothetical protein PHLCEN_2v10249 [Hermanssonia centrifuga]|uniref:CCHC-type domain-containing protein n=1 Tax=Hermanssonia centrifuga TaxID=98765 RepID=A0A2R6NNH7_9APHY|nr:hypothetical protein PHLCEN_2v10249 [Hermanssonia centrifuga]